MLYFTWDWYAIQDLQNLIVSDFWFLNSSFSVREESTFQLVDKVFLGFQNGSQAGLVGHDRFSS